MRIFFASCLNKQSNGQAQRVEHIKQWLSASGHSYSAYIYDQDRMDGAHSFTELSELILNSDVYVAEMSVPSQTLGFQIAYALSNTKPCFYLYHERTYGQPDTPLQAHPSRLLRINHYNESDIDSKLSSFLTYAEKQLATKRTSFMSTQGIDNFLDAESRRLGVPKAELIRQILHEAIGRAE